MKQLVRLAFGVTLLATSFSFASNWNPAKFLGNKEATPVTQPYIPLPPPEIPPQAWLTGPLIAPTGAVIPFGHFEIESYFYFNATTGAYNANWNSVSAENNFFTINPQILFFFGLTSWMDINITPQFSYNHTANQNSVHFGDFPVALDFQLMDPSYTPYFPGIKFTIRETFPTGPYQNLNPAKLLTDQTGQGTFATTFNLVLYDVYHLCKDHFLSTTYSAAYTVGTPVNVHGFNTYGGGYGTEGKILPGDIFQAIVSFEFTLTQNWALALDNVYTHTNASLFFGNPGKTLTGGVASIGTPSSEQISFAPAVEYNFSSNLGIIAGCWFTACGRNSPIFRNAVVSINYTY